MFHMAPVISLHEPNLLCLCGSCLQKVTHGASLAVSVKDDSAVLFCDLTVLTTLLQTLLLPQHLVYPEYYDELLLPIHTLLGSLWIRLNVSAVNISFYSG